jgi:hypothetical protein
MPYHKRACCRSSALLWMTQLPSRTNCKLVWAHNAHVPVCWASRLPVGHTHAAVEGEGHVHTQRAALQKGNPVQVSRIGAGLQCTSAPDCTAGDRAGPRRSRKERRRRCRPAMHLPCTQLHCSARQELPCCTALTCRWAHVLRVCGCNEKRKVGTGPQCTSAPARKQRIELCHALLPQALVINQLAQHTNHLRLVVRLSGSCISISNFVHKSCK